MNETNFTIIPPPREIRVIITLQDEVLQWALEHVFNQMLQEAPADQFEVTTAACAMCEVIVKVTEELAQKLEGMGYKVERREGDG